MKALLAVLLCAGSAAAPSLAQDQAQTQKPQKLIADGQQRSIATWARKGMTQSPVSICMDWQGNIYVAESDRAGNAVNDTRSLGHLNAVEEDLQMRSVEDRLAQIRRWVAKGAFPKDYFTKTEDRVRVVRDSDGDGIADFTGVYAGGFNAELDGIGAGVLWRDNQLYYTCIPNLWVLTPGKDPLVADKRESISYGYGVRWCFFGHDLHGLAEGPDGRIYFSMGDRGYNVKTQEGASIVGVDRGGVFRCWPDGSGMELFYQGLRNPQELAFDDLGELFTGDNNCDSGDRARIVYIVEGGDSGWRQDVQSLPSRGPWNREGMWQTLTDVSGPARPAWTLPPVSYLGDGPSGIAFYPGTGESKAYDRHFFMADFYGSGAKVHSFRCDQDGAGYKLADHAEFYKGVTVTDLIFGYDGRMYLSDWGGGWSPNPNGDLFTITNTSLRSDPAEADAIRNVQDIFQRGFTHRDDAELLSMLAHRDQRVRMQSQFELAKRGSRESAALTAVASDTKRALYPRIHAIWALGQIARKEPAAAAGLQNLLSDNDPEVRAQAARTLGDVGGTHALGAAPRFIQMLAEPSPRAQMYAATALGKVGHKPAIGPLLDLLDANDDKDRTLRHAAAYALSLINAPDRMITASEKSGPGARMGVLLALRQLEHPGVGEFLNDPSDAVAVEAARAVYDNRVESAMPALAAILDQKLTKDRAIEPLMRRAIEANVLLGNPESVWRLVAFAARADVAPAWRLLALERVEGWNQPLKREGVWGNWADLPARPEADVDEAVHSGIAAVLAASAGAPELLLKARLLEARFVLSSSQLAERLGDESTDPPYRVSLLNELLRREPAQALIVGETILAAGGSGPLQSRALEILSKSDPERAVEFLIKAAGSGSFGDRQRAVRLLSSIQSPAAEAALARLASQLVEGAIDRSIGLDVYEAAMKLPATSPSRKAVEAMGVSTGRPPGYSTVLLASGGNPEAGKEVFLHHPAAECVRCHIVGDRGGTAGPSLTQVGSRLRIEKLVESLVEPGAEVAKGYGSVSAMPLMPQFLSPREVRDVAAYLATLNGEITLASAPSLEPAHDPPHVRQDDHASNIGLKLLALAIPLVGFFTWRGMTRRNA